nr:MAG TPA: hypothetical protein [Caudoviricetes sp.]
MYKTNLPKDLMRIGMLYLLHFIIKKIIKSVK